MGVATSVTHSSEHKAVACSRVGFPIGHQGPWLHLSLTCEWGVACLGFSLGSAQTHLDVSMWLLGCLVAPPLLFWRLAALPGSTWDQEAKG